MAGAYSRHVNEPKGTNGPVVKRGAAEFSHTSGGANHERWRRPSAAEHMQARKGARTAGQWMLPVAMTAEFAENSEKTAKPKRKARGALTDFYWRTLRQVTSRGAVPRLGGDRHAPPATARLFSPQCRAHQNQFALGAAGVHKGVHKVAAMSRTRTRSCSWG